MNFQLIVTVVISFVFSCYMMCVSSEYSSISCSSCGDECADACGTRHFRTCCFNYLRKRSPASHSIQDNRPKKLWMLSPQMEKILKLNQVDEPTKTNDLSLSHHGFKYLTPTVGDDQQPDLFYNIPT